MDVRRLRTRPAGRKIQSYARDQRDFRLNKVAAQDMAGKRYIETLC